MGRRKSKPSASAGTTVAATAIVNAVPEPVLTEVAQETVAATQETSIDAPASVSDSDAPAPVSTEQEASGEASSAPAQAKKKKPRKRRSNVNGSIQLEDGAAPAVAADSEAVFDAVAPTSSTDDAMDVDISPDATQSTARLASATITPPTSTDQSQPASQNDDTYCPQEHSHSAAHLIPELCKQFYTLGWVSGTGGGMSIRQGDQVYIAPSGVQKERLQPEDMFVLDRSTRKVLVHPTGARGASLKQSACTPLFYTAYTMRDAGACIHTHSQAAVMATLMFKGDRFEMTHQEMIKGIKKGSSGKSMRYYERLVVPIIENTPEEEDLQERMEQALRDFPETNAVLVRRHGVYCYDYLFELAVKMKLAGLDPAAVPEDEEYDNIGKKSDRVQAPASSPSSSSPSAAKQASAEPTQARTTRATAAAKKRSASAVAASEAPVKTNAKPAAAIAAADSAVQPPAKRAKGKGAENRPAMKQVKA
ncbi:class II aldolase/adducin N-terminal [Catenaria anguillulae PL171]|uniref:Methylthioribulose-1-phosphate dehydratase n=1 Tax=Catenaria anguillulae PL171 TaxID=765915 RepID=A0A1Y2HMU8_9FUNG|nr:class II aldolase/adducin N-terminal [Catenaria anguillulae PL171]